MKAHIYFPVTMSVAYTVEIPDGMSVDDVAYKLKNSQSFYNDHLYPDLCDAEWYFEDVDWDDWTDEVDVTSGQVIEYIEKG